MEGNTTNRPNQILLLILLLLTVFNLFYLFLLKQLIQQAGVKALKYVGVVSSAQPVISRLSRN